MDIKELKEILTVERELYAFLSKIITVGPKKEFLNSFLYTFNDFAGDENQENDEMIKGIITIQKALGHELSESDEKAFMNEYTRLFIGPGKTPIYPYSSVYLNKEPKPKLMDENTIEVRKQYLESNIVMNKLNVVPDDYLGAELEYMAYLTDKSIELIEKEERNELDQLLEKQLNFMENHLITWIPRFSQDLITSTKEDLFKGLALLLKGLIISHIIILKNV
ncbi:MAG: dehydrogenase [Gracilibacter sp. BRH_c7a]|nr:MAG: dehydrogenase [Gracilibacter sp. BRH_c7a]